MQHAITAAAAASLHVHLPPFAAGAVYPIIRARSMYCCIATRRVFAAVAAEAAHALEICSARDRNNLIKAAILLDVQNLNNNRITDTPYGTFIENLFW